MAPVLNAAILSLAPICRLQPGIKAMLLSRFKKGADRHKLWPEASGQQNCQRPYLDLPPRRLSLDTFWWFYPGAIPKDQKITFWLT
jgi:hypothetical protein